MVVTPERRTLRLKYMVRLQSAEHAQWLALVHTGRAAAATLLQARILLKADGGADRRGWTAAESADALDSSAATVHRVRQGVVEQGIEAALSRQRPTGRQYRTLDGVQEVAAWEQRRHEAQCTVDWRFTTQEARIKLQRLYSSIPLC